MAIMQSNTPEGQQGAAFTEAEYYAREAKMASENAAVTSAYFYGFAGLSAGSIAVSVLTTAGLIASSITGNKDNFLFVGAYVSTLIAGLSTHLTFRMSAQAVANRQRVKELYERHDVAVIKEKSTLTPAP